MAKTQKEEILTKCECGSIAFDVFEDTIFNAKLNKNGVLKLYNPEHLGINLIQCSKCEKEYKSRAFMEIV